MANKIRGHGEGSIYQLPSGSWRFQISLQGKRIGKTYKKKVDALAGLRKLQNQLERGFDLDGSKVLLNEYLLQWLENKKTSIRNKTAHQYEQIVLDHIIPHIGNIPLKDLKLAKVEKLCADLLNANVGIRTIRMTHAVLHSALEKAVQYDLIGKNPAHKADVPKYKHSEMTFLDSDQATQFLIAAQDSRYEALYYMAIHTGMRQGELFGLKWTDLDWARETIRVRRQVTRIPKQGWAFESPKTKAGLRTIKLEAGILKIVRQHQARQDLEKIVVGDKWEEFNLMFPSTVGTPGHQSALRKDFLKVLDRAGLPRLRFHDLRHTAATLMLNNDVPPIVVSKRLGHSKTSITLDTYGHLIQKMQDQAAKIMDDLVTPIKVDLRELGALEVEKGKKESQKPR